MRAVILAPGEYYHIYSRGVEKRDIFLDDNDFCRFLLLLMLCQGSQTIKNFNRLSKRFHQHYVQSQGLHISCIPEDLLKEIRQDRLVELVAFSLMPNHFHLLLGELKEKGISNYMQRVEGAFAKYFNTKYDRKGHLFSAPFHAVHIESNEYLKHLSAYIHSNISEIDEWRNKAEKYPWSSYQDFVGDNRWGDFLKPDIITGQFDNTKDYMKFVKESWKLSEEAKRLREEF